MPEPKERVFVSTPFITLHDAVVRRAGRPILAVDDFALSEGESVALLGPNGSGKSTFVSLITREIMPLYRDVPPVLFRGNARATLDEVKRCIGIVSSTMQAQIAVHLPAVELVIGGLFGSLRAPRAAKVGTSQRERAYAVLDELGVGQFAERDVMTLSSGQARRVLIARALVHDPDVLVLDEPCTGLDPEGMYSVRHAMRSLAEDGKAIVLVTHYPEDVIPEIVRIVMLKEGAVFADGAKAELLTSSRISSLFDAPLEIVESNGYYGLSSEY